MIDSYGHFAFEAAGDERIMVNSMVPLTKLEYALSAAHNWVKAAGSTSDEKARAAALARAEAMTKLANSFLRAARADR